MSSDQLFEVVGFREVDPFQDEHRLQVLLHALLRVKAHRISRAALPAAFGGLVHYHKFDKNRMARLRSTYLREAMDTFRREAALADKEGRTDDRVEWQAKLEEAQDLDRRLQWVQEGHHDGPGRRRQGLPHPDAVEEAPRASEGVGSGPR